MTMHSNYETLGISQDATADEIKIGYQKMLEVHHEEISADPKGLRWCLIQLAHDTLLDDEKRAKHDRYLTEAYAAKQPKPQPTEASKFQDQPLAPVEPSVAPIARQIPPAVQDHEENLLKNVKTPVINWDAMSWFNRDYSGLQEKITSRHPGLKKFFFGSTVSLLIVFMVATYANTFPFPQLKGLPINGIFAILVAIFWYRYFDLPWRRKKTYLIFMGLFSVLSVCSLLFGEHTGSTVVLAIIVALFCGLAAYLGIIGAENGSHWRSIISSRQIIRKKLSAKEIRKTTTWGQAGQLDDAVDKFGAQAVALGSAGEKFTAEFMQQLLKIPGTRIFHGLEFPGSENADVDHAIINGDKIVFVDSKMWKAGNYSWQWDGVILRKDQDGETPINSNFHHAVLGYSKRLPEARIRSHILIYSASGRAVIVDNSNAEPPSHKAEPVTEMIAAQEFFEEIGAWFSEGNPGYINKNLVSYLYSKLKPF